MAGSNGDRDEDYDTALQRLMKQCLPPILVEIANRRPLDPIEYMAQSLYKYREQEDFAENKTMLNNNPDMGASKSDRSSVTDKRQIREKFLSKGLIVEESEDFIDINEDLETVSMSNRMVHEQCLQVFKKIGDIFDEDDIS